MGFQALFNANLDDMTQTKEEETLFSTDFEEIANSLDVIEKNDGVLSEEDMKSIENGGEPINSEVEIEEVIDYSKIFEISYHDFLDEKGNPIENDKIMRFTTPVGFNKDNVDSTSNVWQVNYRFYKGGLTGVDDSYWGSQLFDEDIQYFDRAWTSLKWLCQDYLNCVIVADEENFFEAIVYSSDNTYYWYLMLDRLENFDAYGFGTKNNVIAMKVIPIKIEDAANIMYDLGVATEIEN